MNRFIRRIHRLPLELRLFCIIPYTYQLQSPELLRDIRGYRVDIDILDNLYHTQYNDVILLFELKSFCNNSSIITDHHGDVDTIMKLKYKDIWKRHFLYSSISDSNIEKNIVSFFQNNNNIYRKTRFILGLLSTEERNTFINTYVLQY